MMPFWCACWTPWQTCRNSSSRSPWRAARASQYSVIGIAPDQLHHEVRAAVFGGARLEHRAMYGMVHQREGLPLASNRATTPAVSMPGLHELQSDFALDRASVCSAR